MCWHVFNCKVSIDSSMVEKVCSIGLHSVSYRYIFSRRTLRSAHSKGVHSPHFGSGDSAALPVRGCVWE